MTRLHVVVVPEWYPSPSSPVSGVFVRDQVRAAARHHDVSVLAPPGDPPEEWDGDVHVVRVSAVRGGALGRLWALDRALRRLERAPDLLHAHVFSAGLLAVLLGRVRRLPVVVTEHQGDFVAGLVVGWDALVARAAFRGADRVTAVSPLLQTALEALDRRIEPEVLPNVIDVAPFAARAAPPGGARLLTVAGHFDYKGVDVLLDAMELVRASRADATLELVGDGPDRTALERQAGEGVRFHGALGRPQVADMLRHADVLVIPSRFESFGVAAIEALSAKRRVVITSTCGAADDVAAYGGVVIPAGDPARLAEGILRALDGPPPSAPPEALERRFGADAVGRRWDELYRSVAREGSRRRRYGGRPFAARAEPVTSNSTTVYVPGQYWERVLDDSFDLRGVGYPWLSDAFNRCLYEAMRDTVDRVLDGIAEPGRPIGRVLDVGSGVGYWIDYWRRRGASEVVGVDLTEASVERLRSRYPDLEIQQHDIADPLEPAWAGRFDVVSAMSILHHITDRERWAAAVRNVGAALRPGGLLLIMDPVARDGGFRAQPGSIGNGRVRTVDDHRRALDEVGVQLVDVLPTVAVLADPVDARRPRELAALRAAWTLMNVAGRRERVFAALRPAALRLDRLLAHGGYMPSSKTLVFRRPPAA